MKFDRKLMLTAMLAATAFALPCGASAHDYDSDSSDNPLRYVGAIAHAYGTGLSYLTTRPAHYIMSQPKCRYIFGHVSYPKYDDYWGDWDLYQRYSY